MIAFEGGRQFGKNLSIVERLGQLDPSIVLVLRPGPLADLLREALPDRDVRVVDDPLAPTAAVFGYTPAKVPGWAGGARMLDPADGPPCEADQ